MSTGRKKREMDNVVVVYYISATSRPVPDVCTVGRTYRFSPLPRQFFLGLLHAVEGCADGVGTSNLSGSLEGAGVALGLDFGWYFDPTGIMPPFFN